MSVFISAVSLIDWITDLVLPVGRQVWDDKVYK